MNRPSKLRCLFQPSWAKAYLSVPPKCFARVGSGLICKH